MKDVIGLLGNVKKGPKTSIIGGLMMAFGGYLIYETEATLTWASVEVGVFVLGLYFFLTSDTLLNDTSKDKVSKQNKKLTPFVMDPPYKTEGK